MCSSCTSRNTYFIQFTTISVSCSLSSYLRNSLQAPDGYLEEPDIFHISSIPWHAEPLPSPQFHTSSVLLNDTEFCLSYLLFSASHAVLLFEGAQVVCPESPRIFPVKACLAVQTAKSSNSACTRKKGRENTLMLGFDFMCDPEDFRKEL